MRLGGGGRRPERLCLDQMILRNVAHGSGIWIAPTGFLLTHAHQREVKPDKQDHMPAEGLCEPARIRYMCPITQRLFKWITCGKKTELKHLIKYFICGVSIKRSAAEAEELQLVLVGKLSKS